MRVIGFSGKSGTGKSYRAISIAMDEGSELIIDDGLLIRDGKALAGKSAKKEKTWYESTKCAIFMDEENRKNVSNVLKTNIADSVLILGTSDRMVDTIAKALSLPKPEKYIHIEDVASQSEISEAINMRTRYGKHVIPLPTFEIKKSFSGYLLDPITSFKKISGGFFDREDTKEKTIIRPTYGYLGDFEISDRVLCQIASHVAGEEDGVACVLKSAYYKSVSGHEMSLDVSFFYGADIKNTCKNLQNRVKIAIDECTSVYIDSVEINVMSLVLK